MSTKFAEKKMFFLSSPKAQVGIFIYFLLLACTWSFLVFSSLWNPDYTSGEIYDHYLAWNEGFSLYSTLGTEPFRVLNYPPLYFYAVKLFTQIFTVPALLAGRIISLLSAVFSLILLGQWCRKLGLSKTQNLGLIALCATSFPLLYPLPQFHLQWLAVLLSFSGIYLASFKKMFPLFLGAVLLSLGCFTKQTQVITAFIVFLWLMTHSLPKSAWFLFCFGGVSFGIFKYFELQFGSEMIKHLVTYTVGSFSWIQLLRQIFFHLLPWIGFLIFAFWKARISTPKRKDIIWFYFLGQTFWLLSSAREGASYQYFMEWSLATLLWIAPALFQQTPPWLVRLLKVQYIGGVIGVSLLLSYHSSYLIRLNNSLHEICSSIQNTNHFILSDDPGLVRACGQTPAIQPFIFNNLAQKGLWNEEILKSHIQRKSYDYVLFPFDIQNTFETERWSKQILLMIRENYSEEKKIGNFYILKAIKPASAISP